MTAYIMEVAVAVIAAIVTLVAGIILAKSQTPVAFGVAIIGWLVFMGIVEDLNNKEDRG